MVRYLWRSPHFMTKEENRGIRRVVNPRAARDPDRAQAPAGTESSKGTAGDVVVGGTREPIAIPKRIATGYCYRRKTLLVALEQVKAAKVEEAKLPKEEEKAKRVRKARRIRKVKRMS